jgi:hypothetical protein
LGHYYAGAVGRRCGAGDPAEAHRQSAAVVVTLQAATRTAWLHAGERHSALITGSGKRAGPEAAASWVALTVRPLPACESELRHLHLDDSCPALPALGNSG